MKKIKKNLWDTKQQWEKKVKGKGPLMSLSDREGGISKCGR
jgi:hypothetical protein